ncbi:hypothetical protein C7212DRAFT_350766 [Tuber magnatum]|uniref:Uncharacterized protein n=1 Tax=Tuber magnatum TaxID=42249 RepID=A0A317SU60_9PEZI|nr:hypothetical protein C7212DRAFT_350766 [Tuber magnatum]
MAVTENTIPPPTTKHHRGSSPTVALVGYGDSKRLIAILPRACLKTHNPSARGGGEYIRLNSDDHVAAVKKIGRDIGEVRPVILQPSLLPPSNKPGKLQMYMQPTKGSRSDEDPTVRIRRTFERFDGLLVQGLHKQPIKLPSSSEKLFKVIENDDSWYLPPSCLQVALSWEPAFTNNDFADGYVDGKTSVRNYSLSASVACGRFFHDGEDFGGYCGASLPHCTGTFR